MSWNKLDVINLAFDLLNKQAVGDIVNSGEFSNSAGRTFDLLFPTAISGKSWRFCTKIATLEVLVAPPPLDWFQYQLQMPSDYIAAVRTYPKIYYQLYGDKMYANDNIVQLEYRYLPDITHCPVYFITYLALNIAAWYANTVSEDSGLAQQLQAKALEYLGEALFTDSQSHPIPSMLNNPIIQARTGWWDDWDRSPVGPLP